MTSERSPASDHLARALDRAVYASLRPVLIALTVLFCLFAIAPFDPWGRFLFALVSASVLSLLVHIVRVRTVVGFEELRADLERLVSERTRTLASERNLLRTLVDNLPDGVFVKDTAGRYRLANAAHRRQLGLGSSEELAHRTVIEMAPGAWAQREADEDREVIGSGTPILNREQEIQLGIDRVRLVTSKVPVSEPDGVVVGLVGVTRDVTTTREAEEARRILDQQLQET